MSLWSFLSHHKSKLAPFFVRLCVFVPLWWMRLYEVQPADIH